MLQPENIQLGVVIYCHYTKLCQAKDLEYNNVKYHYFKMKNQPLKLDFHIFAGVPNVAGI